MTDGYAGDLTPAEAFRRLQDTDALLLDVRTPAEHDEVGVPDVPQVAFVPWVADLTGPVNPDFVGQVASVVQHRDLLVLCRSGQRSVAAARALTAAGFVAYNVLEGFEGALGADGRRGHHGWVADGLPTCGR